MLSRPQIEKFNRKGFLNAGKVLELGDVDELCGALNEVLDKGPDGFADGEPKPVNFHSMVSSRNENATSVVQIVNIWEACPAFERLIHHPFIVEAIAHLTGFRDLQVWHDQIQYKAAEAGGATTWHQDAPLWPSIEPMTPVSAWLPLDDADEANGCMWMVPGSHKWGNQIDFLQTQDHLVERDEFQNIEGFAPPADAEVRQIETEPCPVRRGEVHFHHSLTWHGSPSNTSPRPRRAIAIHYLTSEARFTGREHVMKQFIDIDVGAPMSQAGPHFPIVCRDGVPV